MLYYQCESIRNVKAQLADPTVSLMLGVEFTRSAHAGCYNALSLCLPVTSLSTRPLRVWDSTFTRSQKFNLEISADIFSDVRFSLNLKSKSLLQLRF